MLGVKLVAVKATDSSSNLNPSIVNLVCSWSFSWLEMFVCICILFRSDRHNFWKSLSVRENFHRKRIAKKISISEALGSEESFHSSSFASYSASNYYFFYQLEAIICINMPSLLFLSLFSCDIKTWGKKRVENEYVWFLPDSWVLTDFFCLLIRILTWVLRNIAHW